MVKPLTFKGDKKSKKRKHHELSGDKPHSSSNVRIDAEEDEEWMSPDDPSQLAGPTVLVLPTQPPTCLASDALGNVFASALENIIEGDPKTAEPHDVRQVWITTQVPGMSKGEYSFKGSHGGYLSCDQYGILGAKREARGREESFVIEPYAEESMMARWQLRTAATKETDRSNDPRYLSAVTEESGQKSNKSKDTDQENEESKGKKVSISLRGDGEASSLSTHIIIKMQARFLPQTEATKEAVRSKEKVSRRELEAAAGRNLTDDEVKRLKRAKREGTYHEEILNLRASGKHDKFA